MSLAGSNRKPALTAAASKIGFSRVTADKLKDEPWQDRAWGVYADLPEIFYMTRYRKDVAAQIEYFVATVDEPGADPNLDEGSGAKVLDVEGGPELLRRVVSELVVHWDVPGEAYLTRFDEAPLWRVLSTQELKREGQSKTFLWGDETNQMGTIDRDNVYRVWDPHPRYHWQADSPVRHVLDNAEELILLTREAKARSLSRINAGTFWIPDGVDMSPFADDEEGTPDDFARELTNYMTRPLKDVGSASSLVPWIITANRDDIAAVRHITFERDWDINLELRRDLLRSVATGLDLPPEILTGMADLNHWSAWLVSEQAVSQHVLPTVDAILDSLTSNWFRPLLEASGVDPDLYVLWRDPSPATVPPDQSDVAIRLNELEVISDEATRRVTNFDEEDAPSPEELERKAARKAAAGQDIPTDGPPDPIRAAVDPDFIAQVAEAVRRLQEGDPPLGRAAVTAAVRRRIVATELADIDAELLQWCQTQADEEIERILGIVGKSLTAATDPLDESLLTRLAAQLDAKIAEAQAAARGWVESLTAKPIDPEPESAFRSQGIQVIIGGILEAVRRRLFTPGATPDPIDTGRIPTVTTPTAAIRNGLSLAGGGPAVYEDGKTSELVGNGQHIHDELEDEGFFQDGYEWKYGHPANTFEPHLHLDGKQFTSWDDPQLAVNLGDSWLRRSHYAPGDHKGCCCAFIQVIVESPLADIGQGGGGISDLTGGEGNLVTTGMSSEDAAVYAATRRRLIDKYPGAAARVRHWGTGEDALSRKALRQGIVDDLAEAKRLGARAATIRQLEGGLVEFDAGGGFDDVFNSAYGGGGRLNGAQFRHGDGTSTIVIRPGIGPNLAPEKVGTEFHPTQYTVTHEFGHAVEHDLLERLETRTPLSATTQIESGFRTMGDAVLRAGSNADVSNYGRGNPAEGFAELFVAFEAGLPAGQRMGLLLELADMAESWANWNARFPEASMSTVEWINRLTAIGQNTPIWGTFKP